MACMPRMVIIVSCEDVVAQESSSLGHTTSRTCMAIIFLGIHVDLIDSNDCRPRHLLQIPLAVCEIGPSDNTAATK